MRPPTGKIRTGAASAQSAATLLASVTKPTLLLGAELSVLAVNAHKIDGWMVDVSRGGTQEHAQLHIDARRVSLASGVAAGSNAISLSWGIDSVNKS